jgi:hypothetical protein
LSTLPVVSISTELANELALEQVRMSDADDLLGTIVLGLAIARIAPCARSSLQRRARRVREGGVRQTALLAAASAADRASNDPFGIAHSLLVANRRRRAGLTEFSNRGF